METNYQKQQNIAKEILDIYITEETMKNPIIFLKTSKNEGIISNNNLYYGQILPNLLNITKYSEFLCEFLGEYGKELDTNYNINSKLDDNYIYLNSLNDEFNGFFIYCLEKVSNIQPTRISCNNIHKHIDIIKDNIMYEFSKNKYFKKITYMYKSLLCCIEKILYTNVDEDENHYYLKIDIRNNIIAQSETDSFKILDENGELIEEVDSETNIFQLIYLKQIKPMILPSIMI